MTMSAICLKREKQVLKTIIFADGSLRIDLYLCTMKMSELVNYKRFYDPIRKSTERYD